MREHTLANFADYSDSIGKLRPIRRALESQIFRAASYGKGKRGK